jgi:hypothetical protein
MRRVVLSVAFGVGMRPAFQFFGGLNARRLCPFQPADKVGYVGEGLRQRRPDGTARLSSGT